MQINSAQDYLTLKKRQIIAATFTQNPPPVKRRNNTIVTALLANKATGYEKVPYAISLAPGTAPGPAYVFPGLRPTVNNCCIQPMASTTSVPTYYPVLTGTTGNTVATRIVDAVNITTFVPNVNTLQNVIDSLGNYYLVNINTHLVLKLTPGGSSFTNMNWADMCTNFASYKIVIDSSDNIYYATGSSTFDLVIYKRNSITQQVSEYVSSSAMRTATGGTNDQFSGIILDKSGNIYFANTTGGWMWWKITPDKVISSTGVAIVYGSNNRSYCAATDSIYNVDINGRISRWIIGSATETSYNNNVSGLPLVVGAQIDLTGNYMYTQCTDGSIAVTNLTTLVRTVIAGANIGYIDGVGASAAFSFPSTGNAYFYAMSFGSDGTLYVVDTGNNAIRTIKGPVFTTKTYYPNAGALI